MIEMVTCSARNMVVKSSSLMSQLKVKEDNDGAGYLECQEHGGEGFHSDESVEGERKTMMEMVTCSARNMVVKGSSLMSQLRVKEDKY